MKTMMNGEAELVFDDVSFWYKNENIVLQEINLSVEKGQFTVLTGANGEGKTTLLKLACGLLSPKRGAILYKNKLIEKQRIGYIPQKLGLIPHMDVTNNILLGRLGCSNQTQKKIDAKNLLHDLLVELHLSHYSETKVCNLSGGEQQKVAIARALIRTPEIIIADEITSNLDRDTAIAIIQNLHYSCMNRNITVLSSIHSPELIKEINTIVIKIVNGTIKNISI